jgi:ABC-type glutathione transport system ATPase component
MNFTGEFVLEVHGLCKTYTQGRWWQRKFLRLALDNVSLALRAGTTLALVGESGCGKTTLAMCIVGLERPDAGEILFNGTVVEPRIRPSLRKEIQLIFQDSAGALNPRMSAIQIVEEPLLISKQLSRSERLERAVEMMERVGLSSDRKDRRPHEFSGGQRQRLAIARALILDPKVLILDEAFVGLDLSIQGQIANLLLDLQETRGLSYICISHDVALVSHFAHTIAVMNRGRIVETAAPDELVRRSDPFIATTWAKARQLGQSALGAHSGV